ncbi:MAG: hypothetical protein ACP5IL_17585, partial [Syntrophobacteraceae bacterium]
LCFFPLFFRDFAPSREPKSTTLPAGGRNAEAAVLGDLAATKGKVYNEKDIKIVIQFFVCLC